MGFPEYMHRRTSTRGAVPRLIAGGRESFQLESARSGAKMSSSGRTCAPPWSTLRTATRVRRGDDREHHGAQARRGRAARQAELNEHQALHDSLTGLPNRIAVPRAGRAGDPRRASATATRVAVMLMDLDRFKEVNDALGHHAGDALLERGRRALARRAARRRHGRPASAATSSACCCPSRPAARGRAPRDRADPRGARAAGRAHELPLAIEASIGVAMFPDHGDDVGRRSSSGPTSRCTGPSESGSRVRLLRRERRRTYDPSAPDARRASCAGRSRSASSCSTTSRRRLLATARSTGSRRCVRWQHPTRGLVLPDEFIPLAAADRPDPAADALRARRGAAPVPRWHDDGARARGGREPLARNLLDIELPRPGRRRCSRARRVEPGCSSSRSPSRRCSPNPARTKRVLERALGARDPALDRRLRHRLLVARLPAAAAGRRDQDRPLVRHRAWTRSRGDAAIVRSTIDLAHNLGLEVVAEGVETAESWDELRARLHAAQGYYLSRPLPAASSGRGCASTSHPRPIPSAHDGQPAPRLRTAHLRPAGRGVVRGRNPRARPRGVAGDDARPRAPARARRRPRAGAGRRRPHVVPAALHRAGGRERAVAVVRARGLRRRGRAARRSPAGRPSGSCSPASPRAAA